MRVTVRESKRVGKFVGRFRYLFYVAGLCSLFLGLLLSWYFTRVFFVRGPEEGMDYTLSDFIVAYFFAGAFITVGVALPCWAAVLYNKYYEGE